MYREPGSAPPRRCPHPGPAGRRPLKASSIARASALSGWVEAKVTGSPGTKSDDLPMPGSRLPPPRTPREVVRDAALARACSDIDICPMSTGGPGKAIPAPASGSGIHTSDRFGSAGTRGAGKREFLSGW
jgi:hypothetical protein